MGGWAFTCSIGAPYNHQGQQWRHPFSLVYGTEAVIPAEIGMPTIRTAEVNVATNDEEWRIYLDLLEERRERAAIREEKSKSKMKGYYDARVRHVSFRPGDFVYRANDSSRVEDTGKLGPKMGLRSHRSTWKGRVQAARHEWPRAGAHMEC